jgi:hypothetical protein
MELATDMEKRYLTVNKNGVLQLVGNYEVDVQVPSENIANDLLITDVYHSKEHLNESNTQENEIYNHTHPYELQLSFNDAKLLWEKRNELYLGIYKKSNNAKRFALINDKVIHDERLKLYCYSYNDGSGDYYFYTPDEWSLEDLIFEDPSVFIHRQLDLRTYNTFEIDYDNYAISLNELYENDVMSVTDVTGGDNDPSLLFRHEDKDLYCYYENAVSKRFVDECFEEGESKIDVIYKVLNKSVRQRIGSSEGVYNSYYSGHFPITPIPLGELLVRYVIYNEQPVCLWKQLKEFTQEEYDELSEVIVRLPYDEGYIFSRFIRSQAGDINYEKLNKYVKVEKNVKFVRWGGGASLRSNTYFGTISIPIRFSIISADEIKHHKKPANSYTISIKQDNLGNYFMKH